MRTCLLLSTLALASSCTIMVNGKPVTLGKRSAPSAQGDGSAAARGGAAPGAPSSDAHPDVVAFYQQANFENCCDGRGDEILAHSGLSTKQMRQGNPDPKWIPGWRRDLYPMVLMSAMMQAAINRTWYPACYEDYEAYRARWKPLEDELRPKLERLRQSTDYYGSVDELRELWARAEAFAAEQDLNLPKDHPGRWSDLRMEILQVFVDLHLRFEDPFAASIGTVDWPVDWEAYRQHAEQWTDPNDARDAYCMHAQRFGTATLPRRQTMDRWEDADPNMVLTPLSSERQDALTATRDGLREAQLASLTLPEAPKIDLLDTVVSRDPGAWVKVRVPGQSVPLFEVEKIARKGDAVELKVEYQRPMQFTVSCRRTNRVVAVHADGRVEYEELCKHKKGTYTLSVTATFDNLPAGLVEVGDIVDFAGTLVKGQPDKNGKDYKVHHRLKVEGVHLWTVVRDGEVVHRY